MAEKKERRPKERRSAADTESTVSGVSVLASGDGRLSHCRHRTQLLQQSELVELAPGLDDLAIRHTVDIDALDDHPGGSIGYWRGATSALPAGEQEFGRGANYSVCCL